MAIRRSSLNQEFYADDVGLKCMECWHYRTHGIPFTDVDEFETEQALRAGRVLDFARDGDTKAQLEALGYLAASEEQ